VKFRENLGFLVFSASGKTFAGTTMTKSSASQMPDFVGELRNTTRTIALWRQKASEFGEPPPRSAFDFSRMTDRYWAYCFLIGTDALGAHCRFLAYGSEFARLLELPGTAAVGTPLAGQLPARYARLFAEGCCAALTQEKPIRVSGIVAQEAGAIELYRAAFLALAKEPNSSTRFIFGSFNSRICSKVSASGTFRHIHNWLGEDIQLRAMPRESVS
jgi:hypothetical protein